MPRQVPGVAFSTLHTLSFGAVTQPLSLSIANLHNSLWKTGSPVGGKLSCPEKAGSVPSPWQCACPVCLCASERLSASLLSICVCIWGGLGSKTKHGHLCNSRKKSKGCIRWVPPLAFRSPKLEGQLAPSESHALNLQTGPTSTPAYPTASPVPTDARVPRVLGPEEGLHWQRFISSC